MNVTIHHGLKNRTVPEELHCRMNAMKQAKTLRKNHPACAAACIAALIIIVPTAPGVSRLPVRVAVLIAFYTVFNMFVNQTGNVFRIGSAIPLTLMPVYLLFFRRKTDLS